jgi:hypothetical protein
MKKRFSLLMLSGVLSVLLLFGGCGGGKGAEDTGEDGKVGETSRTTVTTTPQTAATTDGNLMRDTEQFIEDVLPGDNHMNR